MRASLPFTGRKAGSVLAPAQGPAASNSWPASAPHSVDTKCYTPPRCRLPWQVWRCVGAEATGNAPTPGPAAPLRGAFPAGPGEGSQGEKNPREARASHCTPACSVLSLSMLRSVTGTGVGVILGAYSQRRGRRGQETGHCPGLCPSLPLSLRSSRHSCLPPQPPTPPSSRRASPCSPPSRAIYARSWAGAQAAIRDPALRSSADRGRPQSN